jgi:hypothetical protein
LERAQVLGMVERRTLVKEDVFLGEIEMHEEIKRLREQVRKLRDFAQRVRYACAFPVGKLQETLRNEAGKALEETEPKP